jgi:hypothetical protein
MWTAFPPSEYYADSAPTLTISRQRACPQTSSRMPKENGDQSWFPRSPCTGRRRRCPAFAPVASLRVRRRHSPQPPEPTTLIRSESPNSPTLMTVPCTTTQPIPTRFELARRLRSFTIAGSSRTPFRLACRAPNHLAVLARPGVVAAASRPHLRSQDQTAASFHPLLRQENRQGSYTPVR